MLESTPFRSLTPNSTVISPVFPDWWEVKYALQPGSAALAASDSDGDGLSNIQEYLREATPGCRYGWRRHPGRPETAVSPEMGHRRRRYLDKAELTAVFPHGPSLQDTDGDGISDSVENLYRSDPTYNEGEQPPPSMGGLQFIGSFRPVGMEIWRTSNSYGITASALLPHGRQRVELLNLSVRNSNGADPQTFQMVLRYFRGVVTHSFSSDALGGFSLQTVPERIFGTNPHHPGSTISRVPSDSVGMVRRMSPTGCGSGSLPKGEPGTRGI